MNARFIYMTAGSQDEAHKIARVLVEENLVACANILPGMMAIYRWQGAISEDSEVIVIAKTKSDKVDSVISRVKELHSYECPCIISLPIEQGSPSYLRWLDENC